MKKIIFLALAAMLTTASVQASSNQDDKKCKSECCKKCDHKCKPECKEKCKPENCKQSDSCTSAEKKDCSKKQS